MESLHEPDLLQVTEALIFASDQPVTPRTIIDVYRQVTGSDEATEDHVREAIEALNSMYEQGGRVFRIQRWAGGFQLATEPAVEPYLRTLFSEHQTRRLSRALLESLAIAAYRQPVSKPEVDAIRGVDSGYALKRLLEIGMLEIIGRSEAIGRPLLYGTTDRFLIQFGLDRLDDLPRLQEIEEILDDPELDRERLHALFQFDQQHGSPPPDQTENDGNRAEA